MSNGLRLLRQRADLTIKELAAKIPTHYSHYASIERGEVKLTDNMAACLARALGVDVEEVKAFHDLDAADVNRVTILLKRDDDKPVKRFRINGEEMQAIYRLGIVTQILTELGAFNKRFSGGIEERIKAAALLLSDVNDRVLDHVEDNQLMTLLRNMRMQCYRIGVRGSTRVGENIDGLWISHEQMDTIIKGLTEGCLMCQKNLQERRMCELKKTLDALPITRDDERTDDCQYYMV